MEPRRLELEIKTIVVTFKAAEPRLDGTLREAARNRARRMLDRVAAKVHRADDARLEASLQKARRALAGRAARERGPRASPTRGRRSASHRGRISEQPVRWQ